MQLVQVVTDGWSQSHDCVIEASDEGMCLSGGLWADGMTPTSPYSAVPHLPEKGDVGSDGIRRRVLPS